MTEIEKLEAQVAEWMGVANQQILRIQELEKQLEVAQASSEHVLDNIIKLLEHRIAVLTQQLAEASQQRDSAQALARQAVGVLGLARIAIDRNCPSAESPDEDAEGFACNEVRAQIRAFLSRPEAKAIGGGK